MPRTFENLQPMRSTILFVVLIIAFAAPDVFSGQSSHPGH